MQRGQDERTTTPLGGRTVNGESLVNGESGVRANPLNPPTPTPAPTPASPANLRMMRPAGDSPRMSTSAPGAMSGVQQAAPLSTEELELERIREILVGPHMRDHERRLRMVERHAADLRATASSSEWRAQVEAALERGNQASQAHAQVLQHEQTQIQSLQAELARERQARETLALAHQQLQQQQQQRQQQMVPADSGANVEALRTELARERQARESQAQDAERALSQMTARLDQEREEHEVHMRELQSLRLEQQALRAELTRERAAYDEQGTRHAQTLASMVTRVDQRHEEHAGQHQQSAAELEARLERERQAHAQQVDRLEMAHGERLNQMVAAHNSHVENLHQLVADAEQALVAMKAEREHLAGLLAELGLHLVRHAASPAAARAEEDSQTFLKAAAWWRRRPRG